MQKAYKGNDLPSTVVLLVNDGVYFRLTAILLTTWLLPLTGWGQSLSQADSLRNAMANCRGMEDCLKAELDACDYFLFADPSGAESICSEALVKAQTLGDSAALAKALNYNGIMATIKAQYMTGIERFQESLTVYEQLDDTVGITKLLNNIGVIHSSLENYEEAIRFYERSLAINLAVNDEEGVAFNLHNIASDYLELENYDKARFYADSLVSYQQQHGEFLRPNRLLGEWYLQNNVLDSAEFFLQRSIDDMRERDEEHQLAGAYLSLSELYRKRKDFNRALFFVRRAEQTAERTGEAETLVNVFDVKSKIHYDQGAFQLACDNKNTYIQLKDSLDEVNNFNRITELNTRFETERKEKELAEKEAMLIQQDAAARLKNRVFFIVVGFIVLILGLVSYSLLRKRRINRILNKQNQEISEQRQKIISSINYAKKIQNAILLPESHIRQFLPDSFVFFKPKDIVSGDFYWFAKVEDAVMLATIDCTGHGVPGAFMSLIANSKLNKVVMEMGLRDPGEILENVHREIMESLRQNDAFSDAQDGMDMTLCVIGKTGEPLRYAGANNPLMLADGGTVTEYKGDNLSIGGTFFRDAMERQNGFTTREVQYTPGACLFMFTDGFVDQFGGEAGKKFNKKRFRELLISLCEKGPATAADLLEKAFTDWRGAYDQIDDVLVIGTRLP